MLISYAFDVIPRLFRGGKIFFVYNSRARKQINAKSERSKNPTRSREDKKSGRGESNFRYKRGGERQSSKRARHSLLGFWPARRAKFYSGRLAALSSRGCTAMCSLTLMEVACSIDSRQPLPLPMKIKLKLNGKLNQLAFVAGLPLV
jgi:hypothetical protein